MLNHRNNDRQHSRSTAVQQKTISSHPFCCVVLKMMCDLYIELVTSLLDEVFYHI